VFEILLAAVAISAETAGTGQEQFHFFVDAKSKDHSNAS
jgi:hypothetical protein